MAGIHVLSSGYNEGEVKMYSSDTLASVSHPMVGSFKRCAIRSCNTLLAISYSQLIIADMNFKILHTFQLLSTGYSVAFIESGNVIACGDDTGTAYLFDYEHAEMIARIKIHSDNIRDMRWLPGKNVLATVSWDKSGSLRSVSDLSLVQRFTGHESYGICIDVMPDEDTLLSGGYNGDVLVWQCGTEAPVHSVPNPGTVYGVAIVSNGTLFVTGYDRGNIIVRSTSTYETVYEWQIDTAIGSLMRSWLPEQVVVGARGKGCLLVNFVTGETEQVFNAHTGYVFSVACTIRQHDDPHIAGIQFLELDVETV